MNKHFFSLVTAAFMLVISSITPAFAGDYHHYYSNNSYDVKITNITKGIYYTPFLATTHKSQLKLFKVGEPASDNVIRVAEGGDIGPLRAQLEASNQAFSTSASEGLLAPGESVNIQIDGHPLFRSLSLIAMLLPTNDAMVALKGAKLPKRKNHSRTYYMYAYDAGSEANDEYCASIPGPQCGGVPFSPEDEGEGYVFPHPGLHGEGDLRLSEYQWAGAIAKVVVTRTQ